MKIIESLDKSVSYSVIMAKFGIGKSTVSHINKQRANLTFLTRNGGHGHEETSQSDES